MKLYPSILILSCILFACGSAQKSLQKGNYIFAFEKAVKELNSKPDDKNLITILKESYEEGVTQKLDRIKTLETGNDPYKYEKIANEYAAVNNMYDQLQTVNCCDKFKANYRHFKEEQQLALTNAAQARYANGEHSMALNTRQGAKHAYEEFSKATELVPGYKDAAQQATKAKEAATITVFIQDFRNMRPTYTINFDPFYHQISNYLFQLNRPGGFTEFIDGLTPGYTSSSSHTDQVIQLSFPMIYFSTPYVTSQTVNNSQQISTGKKGPDGKEIMQTITAKVTVYTKTVNARAELYYQILDNRTGAYIYSDKAYSDYSWTHSWAVSSGDKRALDSNNQYLLGMSEIGAPQNQFLFDELTRRLYDDFTFQINNFYSNY